MRTSLPGKHALVAAVMAALGLAACPDDQVGHVRVVREPSAAVPASPGQGPPRATGPSAATAPPGMAGMSGEVPVPPKPEGAEGVAWTLPAGWTEARTGGMRFATLKPPGAGSLDASVVVLPGPAGGELANVNRWRGQLGLAPVDDAEIASLRKLLQTKAGPVALFDFSSEGGKKTRLVAGLAVVNESSWFFKMMGDAEAVGAALPGFTHLLESLRLAGSGN